MISKNKISVVTVHDSANFGSFLQAYALNKFLTDEGYDVSFVRTRDKKYVKGLYYSLRPNSEWIKHPFSTLRKIVGGIRKYKVFRREQQCFKETDQCVGAALLGSDEIWNVKTPVFNYPVFYGKGAEKSVAYAVSAGLAKPCDFDNKDNLKEYIKNISAITVRDDNTADCVEKITGIRTEVVCDPTLLVTRDVFFRKYNNRYLAKHPYLLIYTYEPTPEVRTVLKKFAKDNGLKLVSAGFYYDWCDYNVFCGPLDLCAVMENAKYIITTTFHGTIFSVINHKQFVSVPLSPKTNDVLSRVGLGNRAVTFEDLDEKVLSQKLFNEKIDYNATEERIRQLREKSANLIREGLKSLE